MSNKDDDDEVVNVDLDPEDALRILLDTDLSESEEDPEVASDEDEA